MKLLKSLGVKSILAIAMFLLLLFSASYSFFSMYNISNSTISTSIGSTDMVYTLRGGSELSLDFDPFTFKVDGEGYADATTSTDYVELQASSNIPNMSCTYEIWYTPINAFQNASANNEVVEFELIGEDLSGTNAPFSVNLAGINTPTKLVDGVITVNENNDLVRQTYKYTLRHYNRPFSQVEHYGKNYSGQITFKSTGCNPNANNVITNVIGVDQNNNRVNITVESMSSTDEGNYKTAILNNNTTGQRNVDIAESHIFNLVADTHTGSINTSLDVSSYANAGDEVYLYHYNGSSWDLVGSYIVSSNGTISVSLSSFSPFMLVVPGTPLTVSGLSDLRLYSYANLLQQVLDAVNHETITISVGGIQKSYADLIGHLTVSSNGVDSDGIITVKAVNTITFSLNYTNGNISAKSDDLETTINSGNHQHSGGSN